MLENYHVAESFKIIKKNKDCNIFSKLSKEEHKIIRKRILECVLSTDMALHSKLSSFIKLKIENFNIKNGINAEQISENLDDVALFSLQQEFLNIILHACDISNPTKPLEIYVIWAERVMEEFYLQGDRERNLGLPISFLCDRQTVNISNAQVGFMSGICFPFFSSIIEITPTLSFLTDNINSNKQYYNSIIEKQEKIKQMSKLN